MGEVRVMILYLYIRGYRCVKVRGVRKCIDLYRQGRSVEGIGLY